MSPRPETARESTNQPTSVPSEFSDQLRKTSLLSILMIVGIHSSNIPYLNPGETDVSIVVLWIQTWLSDWLFRIGTPTFMAISGFMFFWSFSMSLKSYRYKVAKRLKNLAAPFLLWSSLGIGLFLILQMLPVTQVFFSKPYLYEMNWWDLLRILIMDPIPYQLWFLRDLIIMSLLSPLVYLVLGSRFSLLMLGTGFAIWFFNLPELGLNNKTTFFYILGAWCAIQKKQNRFNAFKTWLQGRSGLLVTLSLWLVLTVMGSIIRVREDLVIEPVYKLQILCGMNVLWYGYSYWARFLNFAWVDHVKTLTFFIYASHEPLTRIVSKALLNLTPENSLAALLVYFLTMGLVVGVCSLSGIFLKKRLPAVYGPLSGWR